MKLRSRMPHLSLAAALLAVLAPRGMAGKLTLAGDHVEIRYWAGQEQQALEVRDFITEELKSLSRLLDLQVRDTIRVDLVRTQREFEQLAGGKVPPWTLGVSRHGQHHIVLKPLPTASLQDLVRHELTHVLLDMKMGPTAGEVPRWLHEGLAQWMEGDIPSGRRAILGEAAVQGHLLRIADLNAAFQGPREAVELAYAQSYALVEYMMDKGPPGAVGKFLQYLADTGDERLALQRAMGQSYEVVERKWLEQTRARYLSRGVPLTVDLLIIGFMGLIFIAAVVVKLRQAREIRERMQEEELLRRLIHGHDEDDEEEDAPLPGTDDEWRLKE